MTTAVQVGFFCYARGIDAAMAACAAVVPHYDTVGPDMVVLACSGVNSKAQLLMQSTTASRSGLSPPTVTVVPIDPVFLDCTQGDIFSAGISILIAVIAILIPVFAINKIRKMLRWGRGEL